MGRILAELWRKLCLSILFQAIINNLENKISRIFATFTKDIKMEKVVILNKEILAKPRRGCEHTHTWENRK